jgi:hypothetical protein
MSGQSRCEAAAACVGVEPSCSIPLACHSSAPSPLHAKAANAAAADAFPRAARLQHCLCRVCHHASQPYACRSHSGAAWCSVFPVRQAPPLAAALLSRL